MILSNFFDFDQLFKLATNHTNKLRNFSFTVKYMVLHMCIEAYKIIVKNTMYTSDLECWVQV